MPPPPNCKWLAPLILIQGQEDHCAGKCGHLAVKQKTIDVSLFMIAANTTTAQQLLSQPWQRDGAASCPSDEKVGQWWAWPSHCYCFCNSK